MKYEMKVVHNGQINSKLSDWTKTNHIQGYTTLQIHKSYGSHKGPFQQDNVSGEKYFSFLYFTDNQEQLALEIKKELIELNFFVILSEIKCY